MKPRIEKKLSKRLVEIAPNLFKDAWIDRDFELWQKFWPHHYGGKLTSKQKRANMQQKVRVNNVYSVGGGVDYWGEGMDCYSCWQWLKDNWPYVGDFPNYPQGHEFAFYPDTGKFKPTARNLLQLVRDCERRSFGDSQGHLFLSSLR